MSKKEPSLLQKSYIQKSKLFLLPLTGLRKNKYFKETNTYISSPDLMSLEYPNGIGFDEKIIIVVYSKDYKIRQDNIYNQVVSGFKNISIEETAWDKYETEVIASNRRFLAVHETSDEFIYTFDLADWSKDWDNFVKGRYSLMSSKAKDLIKDYRWNSLTLIERRKLYCYLYPNEENCFKDFAEDLEVPIEDLKEVKELCSKPNLKLETYILSEKKQLNETEG